MKHLQYLLDQVTRSETMIKLNIDVVSVLLERFEALQDALSASASAKASLQSIRYTLQEHHFLCKNVSCLSKRAGDLLNHVGLPSCSPPEIEST